MLSFEDEDITVIVRGDGQENTRIEYRVHDYRWGRVEIEEKEYWRPFLGRESNVHVKGMPDLPSICRSIIIPDDARMDVRIISTEYQDFEGIAIAPSKGVIPRYLDPELIPYEFGEVYERDMWYPEDITELCDPYILRDYRGLVVKVYPFQYNPVRKKLRVFSRINIEVFPAGSGGINVYRRTEPPTVISSDFKHIYENHFLNFNTGRYTPVEEQGNMLIITYDSFATEMEPFVAWKNMKGIPTEMVNVSDIGSGSQAIKNYIADYYNDFGLTFVLLVGDAQQVPTYTIWGYAASDPTYSYVVGNDHYPDLFVGRFSAQNTGHVSTMVERTIEYERYPQEGTDWYEKGVGIASDQGPGDDGEFDYEHIRNIRTDLLDYTYSWIEEFYDGSQGGMDGPGNPSAAMVRGAINDGRSVINYCGHGWAQGWVTSGFENSDVNILTNDNRLPFIWSVACDNGDFEGYSTCFAEAWLRATHNSEPTGAIATFMSSISQYWDEPMDAQDEMNDILVESYTINVKHTFGGISFNGCMHMNDEYGSSGYDMTDTWHVFGDPSVEVRTDTPCAMTVYHDSTVSAGSTSFEVTVSGLEGALCSISRDASILGYAYTDESGYALIEFSEPLTEGQLDLVVTAYNKIPYETTVEVITAGEELFYDNENPEFVILYGPWMEADHPSAYNGSARFTGPGTGTKVAGWRVDESITPGTYDVYTWKFEHDYMHLMATDVHYKVFDASGVTDWILVDQSAPGDEWIYLGQFEFDNSSIQGVLITDEADGFVIADAVKLVSVGP